MEVKAGFAGGRPFPPYDSEPSAIGLRLIRSSATKTEPNRGRCSPPIDE